MSRSAPNPRLFSGYSPLAPTPETTRDDLPKPSPEDLARRALEDAEVARATAAAKAKLPIKAFTFFNAKAQLKIEVFARSEEDALTTLRANVTNYPASAWRCIPTP